MSIREIFDNFIQKIKNRNLPRIERGRPEEVTHSPIHDVDSSSIKTSSRREQFRTSLSSRRPNCTPRRDTSIRRIPGQNTPRSTQPTPRKATRLVCQKDSIINAQTKAPSFRATNSARLAAIVFSGALILSGGITLANSLSQHHGDNVLRKVAAQNYADTDLDLVYEEGLKAFKGKFAEAIGIPDKMEMIKLQSAEFTSNGYSPTQIITPDGKYFESSGSDESYSTFSPVIKNVVDELGQASIGTLSTEQLENLAEQIVVFSESNISTNKKDIGSHVSIDNNDEHAKILEELQSKFNQMEQDITQDEGREPGD